MDFKGTKGKWEFTNINPDRISVCQGIIDVWGFEGKEEMKANALLISKAPEMLEMLNKVLEVNKIHNFNGHLINEQIELLIKQAIEL